DADGEALREALLAPPNYIKPNRDELIEYFGAPVGTGLEQLLEMCGQLLSTGVELVVLSMGADGALFVNCDQAFHAPGLKVKVHSTVGAGDSMVGALAYAMQQGLPFEQAAALSVAASAGAVTTTGTNPPDLQTVHKLQSQVVLNKIK
ncbi:PfkB family carbohydrate kinase, partial [Hydrogenoanaerobacterium sp.]|uniref:PfkB family carbohydrate kinase n=1 Tax=Hydrogenoanaerobacterium sp. TaxID=2953763 RepID=UPI00289B3ADA